MENIEGCKEGEEVDIQSTSGESVPQSAPPMEDLVKSLRDYAFLPADIPPVIRRPTIQANNFEISLSLYNCFKIFNSWDFQMKTLTHKFIIS